MENIESDLKAILESVAEAEQERIMNAYAFARVAHTGKKRSSGDEYVSHPVAVARILSTFDVPASVLVAGLLHDTVSDGNTSLPEIEKEFGKDVRGMVEGIERLGSIKYRGTKRHAESLRKFFVVITNDVRIMLIKLAERLHNMRTLSYVPKEKRARIALETMEIYAPLANRLGMGELKGELQDLAFLHSDPEKYNNTRILRETRVHAIERNIKKLHRALQKKLAAAGFTTISIDSRIKHLWSLRKKLDREPNQDIGKIYDIIALRIVAKSIDDCYKILGVIHATWKPVSGRVKDYIATPKPNGYQSLHTTIFSGDGTVAEIQIRTALMHEQAEYGVASHLVYDEMGKPKKGAVVEKHLSWATELLQQSRKKDATELLDSFFQQTLFVFTPKGEVVELPDGSTPIDFAYAIHSSIGNRANGALINGKMSALDTPLHSNDVVEIITKKTGLPHEKWLTFVKTSEAKRKIRAVFRKSSTKKK